MISRQEFVETLQERFGIKNEVEQNKDLRYVMYVRKSTTDEAKQVRSIGDQISDCKRRAVTAGIRISDRDIVVETESAKEADMRPKFRKMLDEIKANRYDAILAWHPDRLSRNMKEAGEIIDLIDKGVIKNLLFDSYTFTNDTSGKTMLGMIFVMSKQYSDHLSDGVKRGIRNSTLEGAYLRTAKHGYYKIADHKLKPDDENFLIIKNLFDMRLEGKGLKELSDYLKQVDYPVKTKHGQRKKQDMSIARVSDILRNPIFAGILIYGDVVVDLVEKYGFTPAVSLDDFMKICPIEAICKGYKLMLKIKPKGSVKANFMRGMVTCGDCGRLMSTGLTSKEKKGVVERRLLLRCDTDGCPRHNKSIRGKVIVDFVKAFLQTHPFNNPKAYASYKTEMVRLIAERTKHEDSELRVALFRSGALKTKLESTKEYVLQEKDPLLKKEFAKDIREYSTEAKALAKSIKEMRERKDRKKEEIYTYDEFLELFKKLANVIDKFKTMKDLDIAIKKMFSNFVIKDKKIASYTQNSPFGELAGHGDSVMVTPPGIEPGLMA